MEHDAPPVGDELARAVGSGQARDRSVFLDAIRVLEERGWAQGIILRADGAVCLAGAINQACSGDPLRLSMTDEDLNARDHAFAAIAAVTGRLPHSFNDDPLTTYEDVVSALKQAHYLMENGDV